MSTPPIEVAPDDPVGPPRHNGELAFDAPWQGRAFGLCLALLEKHGLGWDAFRVYLTEEIAAAPGKPYYDNFVPALERFSAALIASSS